MHCSAARSSRVYHQAERELPKVMCVQYSQRVHVHGDLNHNKDGLSRPNSIIAVYMDPLG